MRFEQNDFKIYFYLLKITYKYFDRIPFDQYIFCYKHACLRNFPEIRGTENSGSAKCDIKSDMTKYAGLRDI